MVNQGSWARVRPIPTLTPNLDSERRCKRRAADPEVGMHGIAIMAGPESVPEDFYTETHRNRVLGRAS